MHDANIVQRIGHRYHSGVRLAWLLVNKFEPNKAMQGDIENFGHGAVYLINRQ